MSRSGRKDRWQIARRCGVRGICGRCVFYEGRIHFQAQKTKMGTQHPNRISLLVNMGITARHGPTAGNHNIQQAKALSGPGKVKDSINHVVRYCVNQ